jgi:hypothetical protein
MRSVSLAVMMNKGGRRMRDLKRELDTWTGYPPAWKPKPGEVLVAFIDGYDIGHTPYGPVRMVVVIEETTNQNHR